MVALRVADKAKVLLCGYYGEHNLGDDALLQVLVSQLPDAWHPVITARDHQAVASLVPSASIVNRRSLSETIRALQHVDALVLGGGSLLQDGTSFKSLLYYLILLWSARWNRIPIILWGQGLGPLRRQWSRWCVRATLGRVQAVSWRDPASLQQAQQWRLRMPMVMGPDPVWCHPAPAWSGGPRPHSLPKTHSAAEHEGLADVVAGPGSLQRPITFEGDLACIPWRSGCCFME